MNTLPYSQRPSDSPRAHRDDGPMAFTAGPGPLHTPPRRGRPLAWVAILALLGIIGSAGVLTVRPALLQRAHTGSLRIESEPAGAIVDIDGSGRGLTPLTVALAPGAHTVVVTHGDQTQQIDADIAAGSSTTHHVRWAPAAPVVTTGRLQITSEPAGGIVTVDGTPRGTAPLSVHDLEPGEHQVVVQVGGRTHRRAVTVEAGETASLVIANAPASIESGWLVTRAGVPLQIFERGRLIGATDSERILLPAGSHDLEFVGDALGFRARRSVTVTSGQTTTVALSLPQAAVNLNAVPWADVTIGGKEIGQTPIANLMLPIGTHQVTFRHPQLGEKQATVTVSLQEATRLAVDMRAR